MPPWQSTVFGPQKKEEACGFRGARDDYWDMEKKRRHKQNWWMLEAQLCSISHRAMDDYYHHHQLCELGDLKLVCGGGRVNTRGIGLLLYFLYMLPFASATKKSCCGVFRETPSLKDWLAQSRCHARNTTEGKYRSTICLHTSLVATTMTVQCTVGLVHTLANPVELDLNLG